MCGQSAPFRRLPWRVRTLCGLYFSWRFDFFSLLTVGGAASHERLLTQMANLPSLEELSKSAHLALNSLEIPSTFQPGVTISTEDEGEVETEVQIEVESSWPIPDTHLLVCMCTPQTYCIHPLHPLLARRCGVWMKLPSLPFQMTVGAFSSGERREI